MSGVLYADRESEVWRVRIGKLSFHWWVGYELSVLPV